MEDQGLLVRDNDHGPGFVVEGQTLQESRQSRVVCLARFPNRVDVASTQLTPEQLRVHHDWMVDQVLPCIADLGIQIDTDVPAAEQVMAAYEQDEPLWFPTLSREDLEKTQKSCDLLPPPEEVYPDGQPQS